MKFFFAFQKCVLFNFFLPVGTMCDWEGHFAIDIHIIISSSASINVYVNIIHFHMKCTRNENSTDGLLQYTYGYSNDKYSDAGVFHRYSLTLCHFVVAVVVVKRDFKNTLYFFVCSFVYWGESKCEVEEFQKVFQSSKRQRLLLLLLLLFLQTRIHSIT